MSKKRVTESPEELIIAGNGNANSIITLSDNIDRFNEWTRGDIGVLAQQMTEKFLKAYLRNDQRTKDIVNHGHDLRLYLDQARHLDDSFEKIIGKHSVIKNEKK